MKLRADGRCDVTQLTSLILRLIVPVVFANEISLAGAFIFEKTKNEESRQGAFAVAESLPHNLLSDFKAIVVRIYSTARYRLQCCTRKCRMTI